MLLSTVFLTDVPESNDAFGPHGKIASLLHADITGGSEGHAIGLIGEWGSGKSTIITILEKLLRTSGPGAMKNVAVFKYDAWAHQGDSLRRSFLDDLLYFLKARQLLTEEQATNQSSRIWDKIEETKTTTEPILRPHVTWLIFSGLLIPLGGVIESFNKPGPHDPVTWVNFSLHLLSSVLVLVPLALFGLFGLINKFGSLQARRRIFGADDLANFKVTSVFIERVSGKKEQKIVRSAQDSVIEFRNVFDRLIELVSATVPDWRFVIVIDNIDRLPIQQARSFWGTMATFFDRLAGTQGAQKKNYWLLVPFSEAVLTNVFEDDGNSGGRVARAFVEKTFDMVLRVPPPVLATWREYFLACLQIAFPAHSSEELREVRNIFDLLGSTPDRLLTPRYLKLFINELVALYRQREGDIELPVLAAFILKRDALGHNGEKLLSGDVLEEREVSLLKAEGRLRCPL